MSASSLVADTHHIVAQERLLAIASGQQGPQSVACIHDPKQLVARVDKQHMDESALVHPREDVG